MPMFLAQTWGHPAAKRFAARYGEHWGEGAARCFSLEADILDEDGGVRHGKTTGGRWREFRASQGHF